MDDELENALILSDLAKWIPGNPSYHSVRKWCIDGAKSQSGQIIKLKSCKLPGGRASSKKEYLRFIKRLNQ